MAFSANAPFKSDRIEEIQLSCQCCSGKKLLNHQLVQRLVSVEQDLVDVAKRLLRTAGDPVSAVVRFLHERPENSSLPGYVVDRLLVEAFGDKEHIPGLISVLAGHMKETIRQSNVINIINEHAAVERWGNYIIKAKELIKFEISREKGKLVLKDIVGLKAVENGIELGLERILIDPPKLQVTVRLGVFPVQRTVDIV
jgi:hypothetical protein